MSAATKRSGAIRLSVSALVGLLTVTFYLAIESRAQVENRFAGPTSSQPMALSADGSLLAVVNPDNDTVSFFDVQSDANRKLAEIAVETEPNSVAVNPAGTRAYVANTVSACSPTLPWVPSRTAWRSRRTGASCI